jgi:hypothetical protein
VSHAAAALHHPIVAPVGIEADVCTDNVPTAPMWRRTTLAAPKQIYAITLAQFRLQN